MQMPPRLRWPKFRASQDSSASAATLAWPASPSATGHPWEHHCSFAPFWKTRSELHRSFVHLSRLLRRRDTSAGVQCAAGACCDRRNRMLSDFGVASRPVNTAADFIDCSALRCPALRSFSAFNESRPSASLSLVKRFFGRNSVKVLLGFARPGFPGKDGQCLPPCFRHPSSAQLRPPVSPPTSPCHPASMHADSPSTSHPLARR